MIFVISFPQCLSLPYNIDKDCPCGEANKAESSEEEENRVELGGEVLTCAGAKPEIFCLDANYSSDDSDHLDALQSTFEICQAFYIGKHAGELAQPLAISWRAYSS